MKKILIVIIVVLTSNIVSAQFVKEKSINAIIGYGISVPYNSMNDVADRGLLLQGELVLKVRSWFELRPYAGLILTSSNGKDLNNKPTDEKAESKAFLLGGKARLRAPIPWVAPYLELGIGTSIGKFETLTLLDNIDKGGMIFHLPIAFGLELGKNNNVDLGFSYYYQPSVEQYVGAIALGFTIPLKK
ncbi:hypothetical protein KO504_00440 [Winogradskyella psychrotolerans]|uniref:hypothetical protein n=1 Tax=Winogradskyella psychrotolerans TaxID=1344585 RepID=UPI001C076821|nr:hypothetical protein [Winogradskyella psychrotolerans]MBU2919794.1 hypothetical protein [Winogradskyella psychrotolerans]